VRIDRVISIDRLVKPNNITCFTHSMFTFCALKRDISGCNLNVRTIALHNFTYFRCQLLIAFKSLEYVFDLLGVSVHLILAHQSRWLRLSYSIKGEYSGVRYPSSCVNNRLLFWNCWADVPKIWSVASLWQSHLHLLMSF
jgi:hypothetical protein